MKYETEIFEMARVACLFMPENVQHDMDISDEYFEEIRNYLFKEEIDHLININIKKEKTK